MTYGKISAGNGGQGYTLKVLTFGALQGNSETRVITGMWNLVKNKEFVMVGTSTDIYSKCNLITHNETKRVFQCAFTKIESDYSHHYYITLTVNNDDSVNCRYHYDTNSGAGANYKGIEFTQVLVPDYDITL